MPNIPVAQRPSFLDESSALPTPEPQPPQSAASVAWVESIINIRAIKGTERLIHRWPGRCANGICIHKSFDGKRWVVTHLGSGCLMILTETEVDALRIANVLLSKESVKQALILSSKEALLAAFPAWVKPWLEQCYQKHCYTPPPAEVA